MLKTTMYLKPSLQNEWIRKAEKHCRKGTVNATDITDGLAVMDEFYHWKCPFDKQLKLFHVVRAKHLLALLEGKLVCWGC